MTDSDGAGVHKDREAGGRTRFRRKADYAIVAAIVVAGLTISLTVWARSDIHNTVSQTASADAPMPRRPVAVPASLHEAWHARSTATPVPVAVGPTVVTAADGAVLGRVPATGAVRWRYQRDLGLCTVSSSWSMVLALYHKSRNCSEVTALNATTGARGPQRNGDAELGTRLVGGGTYVTTTGPTLSDTWRSDLVQTTEYGKVPDFNNPKRQPRPQCTHGSVVAGADRVGIIEHCPGDDGDRVTVYAAKAEDSDTPDVMFSKVLQHVHGARLVAMTDSRIAVATPKALQVRDASDGRLLASFPLYLPASDFASDPPGDVTPAVRTAGAVYWYTGSSTVALALSTLHPLWTVRATLGAGCAFAGKVLLPVAGGIAVVDPATGVRSRTIAVGRHGYTGRIAMTAIGSTILEQRGGTLVALRGSTGA